MAEIGKLAVKVWPDTSRFREDLRRKLMKERKQHVLVGARLDDKGLRADVLKTVQNINAENAVRDHRKIRFRALLDGQAGEMLRSVDKASNEMNRQAKAFPVKFPVELEDAMLGSRLPATMRRIEDRLRPIKIDVEPDHVNLADLRRRIDDSLRDYKVTPRIDTENPLMRKDLRDYAKNIRRTIAKNDIGIKLAPPSFDRELMKSWARDFDKRRDEAFRGLEETANKKRYFEKAMGMDQREDITQAFDRIGKQLGDSIGNSFKNASSAASRHRKELMSELDRVKEGLTTWGSVPLEIDPKKRKEIERQMAELRHKAEEIKIKMDPEIDPLKLRAIDRTLRQLRDEKAQIDIKLRVDDELDEFEVRRLQRKIEEIDDRIHAEGLKLKPEVSQEHLQHLKHQLDEIEDKYDGLELQMQPGVSEPFYRRVQMRLAWLTRMRFVPIVARVAKSSFTKAALQITAALSGARLVDATFGKFWNQIKNLDKNIPKVVLAAQAVGLLGASLLSMTSNTVGLAGSLAQIVQAGLLLPGIMAGLTVGLLATVVALGKFKDYVPQITGYWEDMKAVMIDNFWARAQKPMAHMVDTLMPQAIKGFDGASTAIGNFFAELSKGVTKGLDGSLQGMFDDLTKSIEINTKYAQNFGLAIGVLGRVGAGYLPRLAQWFGTIGDRFTNWLITNEKSGRLFYWAEGGILALRELGNVVYETGRFFHGLYTAAHAAGGTTLTTLAANMKRLADTVKEANFQRNLTGAFRAAHEMFDVLALRSGPRVRRMFQQLAHTATTVLPEVGAAAGELIGAVAGAIGSPEFQRGLRTFFVNMRIGIEELVPAFEPLGVAMGGFMDSVGRLAKNFAPILGTTLEFISDAFMALKPSIDDIIDVLSSGFGEALEILSPPLRDLLEKVGPKIADIAKALGDALPGIAESVADVVEAMGPLIEDILELGAMILPPVLDALSEVLDHIADHLPGLTRHLSDLFDAIKEGESADEGWGLGGKGGFLKWLDGLVKHTQGGAMTAFMGLLAGIETAFMGFFEVLGGLFEGLSTAKWDTFWEGVVDSASWGIKMLADVIEGVGQIVLGIIDAFAGTDFADRWVAWWDKEMGKVDHGLELAKNNFDAMKHHIKEALSDAGTWLVDAGKNMMEGLKVGFALAKIAVWQAATDVAYWVINGLKVGFALSAIALWQAVLDIGSLIIDTIKDILGINSPSTVMIQIGRDIIQGLINGMTEMLGQLIAKVTEIGTRLRDKFVEWKNNVINSWNDFRDRFGQKVGDAVGIARTKAGEIGSAIRERLNTAKNQALSILDQLRNGIAARFEAIRAAVASAVNAVRNTISSAFTNAKNAALRQIDALASGIRGKVNAVRSAGAALASAANSGLRSVGSSAYSVGANIGQGLVNGMRSMLGRVASIATQLIATAARASAAKAQIHSPSRLWFGQGSFIGQGLVLGMESMLDDVYDMGEQMAEAVEDGFNPNLRDLNTPAMINGLESNTATAGGSSGPSITAPITVSTTDPNAAAFAVAERLERLALS